MKTLKQFGYVVIATCITSLSLMSCSNEGKADTDADSSMTDTTMATDTSTMSMDTTGTAATDTVPGTPMN